MTKREIRKLEMHEDDKAALKAAGMDDSDIELLTLMKVVKTAVEEQLMTKQPDGSFTCIINAAQMVELHIKSTAYWLGMSKGFDDPEELLKTVSHLAIRLMQEVMCARETFKTMQAGGLPDNVHIIDSGSDTVN
jgi:GMP synthase PP-ATPase subunit